jgi:small-conductance mechanosensitive channel
METIISLLSTLFTAIGELLAAFASPEFYIELMCVLLALSLAWLVALLVHQRLDHFEPKRINVDFLKRPMPLLAPLLAIIYLGVFTPFALQYGDGGLLSAVMRLTIAYLVARGVMLIVSPPMGYFIAGLIMLVAGMRVMGLLKPTVRYLRSLEFELGTLHLSVLNIIHGVVILIVVFWLASAASRTLEGYLRRSSSFNYNTRELIVKFFRIFVYLLALTITLSAMGVDLTAFAVFGGALGVGIGLGLQKIAANFISGITLLMEKSIKLGDLIEVAGTSGWIRQLNIRYALMETFDGRELLIPNEELMTTRVINWTYSNEMVRIEIKVGVPYEADPVRVRELLLEAAREHPKCLKKPEATCFLQDFGEAGFIFLLNFWIPDIRDGRGGPRSDVLFAIHKKFREAGIEIRLKQFA